MSDVVRATNVVEASSDRRRSIHSEARGAVAPLMLAAAGILVILAVGLGDLARFLSVRVATANAADAAALAAAPVTFRPFGARGSPHQEAARFAAANGARLVECTCRLDPTWNDREVTVVVRRHVELWLLGDRTVTAVGRARFAPSRLALPPEPSPPGIR